MKEKILNRFKISYLIAKDYMSEDLIKMMDDFALLCEQNWNEEFAVQSMEIFESMIAENIDHLLGNSDFTFSSN